LQPSRRNGRMYTASYDIGLWSMVFVGALPYIVCRPAQMWRIVNVDAVAIDWSVSNIEFLSRTIAAGITGFDRQGRPISDIPVGIGDWSSPFACSNSSILHLHNFPNHRLFSSSDNAATPDTAAFTNGNVWPQDYGFGRATGDVWRSNPPGPSRTNASALQANEGFLGIDFGSLVDVRCVRVTQGPTPNFGPLTLRLESRNTTADVWTEVFTRDVQEYPLYKSGTATLIVEECPLTIQLPIAGTINFTGGYKHPRSVDCSWSVVCPNQSDVVAISITELSTEHLNDSIMLYDGLVYTDQGVNAPPAWNTTPEINTTFRSYHGRGVPSCAEDEGNVLSSIGLDCSTGETCMKCIPTAHGCVGGSCPELGSMSADGRRSTCIAGSRSAVSALSRNISCDECNGLCRSALRRLGSCGGDVSLLNPLHPNSTNGLLLSDVCPITCNRPCAADVQSSVSRMTVRFTADGTHHADGFIAQYGCSAIDACGVALLFGGDNSTCSGCDGTVGSSGVVFDECGVCGGDGESCKGCDGVRHSGLVFDACGICGGFRGSRCAHPCNTSTGLYMEQSGSLDFGTGYSLNHMCEWHLVCPRVNSTPIILFSKFETENNLDFVQAFDGRTQNVPQMSHMLSYSASSVPLSAPLSGLKGPGYTSPLPSLQATGSHSGYCTVHSCVLPLSCVVYVQATKLRWYSSPTML
jgi:hypothetical protein